jgi:hypothetical protein
MTTDFGSDIGASIARATCNQPTLEDPTEHPGRHPTADLAESPMNKCATHTQVMFEARLPWWAIVSRPVRLRLTTGAFVGWLGSAAIVGVDCSDSCAFRAHCGEAGRFLPARGSVKWGFATGGAGGDTALREMGVMSVD